MTNCSIRPGLTLFQPSENDFFPETSEKESLFSVKTTRELSPDGVENISCVFQAEKEGEGRFFADISLPSYREEWFLFMPSTCYDGNRFKLLPMPPMKLFMTDYVPENPLDPGVVMLELPSLDNGFNRAITDSSAPVAGIWKRNEKEAVFLSFEQGTFLGDNGIEMSVTEDRALKVRLSLPVCRRKAFALYDNLDKPAHLVPGMTFACRFQIRRFVAENFADFYRHFAAVRNLFPEQGKYRNSRSFSHASEILMDYFETGRWNEKWGFYGKSINNNRRVDFGWVSFVELPALLAQGGEKTLERVKRQLTGFFQNAPLPNGLFYPAVMEREGKLSYEASFVERRLPYDRPWGFLRHQCEILLTSLKCLLLMEAKGETIPESWKKALLSLAETIRKLWEKYGQLGAMVDLEKGELIIGGSDNGCSAPGALITASKYFGREDLAKTALALGEYYASRLDRYGFTCGGPGDALFAPDSESAFAVLESFVLLYEATGEEKWLKEAEYSADYCSSWTPAVAWKFPKGSMMDLLKIDCRGAVQANLQNQHGAPGCCTLSASALMRLYLYTGEERFLLLLQEIAHNCVQYISTKDHPISSRETGRTLQEGAICEKVFFQDFKHLQGVNPAVDGGWTGSSVLLTITEDPGIFWDRKRGKLFVLDHVEAKIEKDLLTVKNPLSYPVTVNCRILEEEREKPELFSGLFPRYTYRKISLSAGETKTFSAEELKKESHTIQGKEKICWKV
ncbi:MAG: hypothetical protein J6331_09010 [Lentisphaeria bacterium]|nr:hypothetical protein [Lentisphaeria bacterium]